LHRNRFPKKLPSRRMGREIVYDWCSIVKIMDALLSEKPTRREKGARGGSVRKLWLEEPLVRARVLRGIGVRMCSISAPERVKSGFHKIIRRHLPNSAK